MPHPSVSLVIPMYNESSRVDLLFRGIDEFAQAWQGPFEVILVNDGSQDDTGDRVIGHPSFQAMQGAGRLILLNQANTGKGGALKHGVMQAKSAFILTLDADMATRPVELLRWLERRQAFRENEILIGSRELTSSVIQSSNVRRRIGNIFNWIIRVRTGIPFLDTQCGFKLYPSEAAKRLFGALQTYGWSHDLELLLRAIDAGYHIVEMPVHWEQVAGSKINMITDSWKMFWEVMRIAALRKRW